MRFPFSYTGEVIFYKPEGFSSELFLKSFYPQATIHDSGNGFLVFTTPITLLKLPVKVKIWLADDNTSIQCNYQISMLGNNLVILLGLLFMMFFMYFHAKLPEILSPVLAVFYYVLNTLRISSHLKKIIYSYLGFDNVAGKPELWQQQIKWMQDQKVCPACGEEQNPYSVKCVNCGLFLHKKPQKLNQINTSNPFFKDVHYEFKKGGNEKNSGKHNLSG